MGHSVVSVCPSVLSTPTLLVPGLAQLHGVHDESAGSYHRKVLEGMTVKRAQRGYALRKGLMLV